MLPQIFRRSFLGLLIGCSLAIASGKTNLVSIQGGWIQSEPARAVFAGDICLYAVLDSGKVKPWGDCQELGFIQKLRGVKAIVATGSYSRVLALLSNGTLTGSESEGEFAIPKGLTNIKAIDAGENHFLALSADGTVTAWGKNDSRQCDVPKGLRNVESISAGAFHSVALLKTGTIVTWGDNTKNQTSGASGRKGVKAISAGRYSTAVLFKNGRSYIWGEYGNDVGGGDLENVIDVVLASNSRGQTSKDPGIPKGAPKLSSIAFGGRDFAGLDPDGNIYSWGGNQMPKSMRNVASVALGEFVGAALRFDGTVTAWSTGNSALVVPALAAVKDVAFGENHALVLQTDGTLTSWGSISSGQMDLPAELGKVKAIAAGGAHSLAVKTDGTVVAWGAGRTFMPFGKAAKGSGARQVAIVGDQFFALTENGAIKKLSFGELSDVTPPGVGKVKAIFAREYTCVALMEDGKLIELKKKSTDEVRTFPPSFINLKSVALCPVGNDLFLTAEGRLAEWNNRQGREIWHDKLGKIKAIAAKNNLAVALGYDDTLSIWTGGGYPTRIPAPKPMQTIFVGDGMIWGLSAPDSLQPR
ncbi:MAG: hypothetical protein RL173_1696 [Fibrobacterota bacterium]|jgi:alpha-tubulin suppressor-like RCC1 family protein